MSFSSQDAQAINQANDNQFNTTVVDVSDTQQSMMRIDVGSVVPFDGAAVSLADAMMASERFFNQGSTTTVWINVTTERIPAFVNEAIGRCGGYGLGLIVTHNGLTSHAPGELISEECREKIRRAGRSGFIWHPLADKLVRAEPA